MRAFPPDEASRGLIDLANARGGKDNVTCLVVLVPDAATGLSRVAGSGVVRGVRRQAAGVNRAVPWPFVMLGVGSVLAGLSVTLNLNSQRALAVPAFGLATAAILAGLIGLYVQLKRRGDANPGARDPSAGGLHLYREHSGEFTPELAARMARLGDELKAAVESTETPADWDRYAEVSLAADAASAKGDWATAFADRFRATQLLASALHAGRNKGEGFNPSYR